jgi:hypothetical protein
MTLQDRSAGTSKTSLSIHHVARERASVQADLLHLKEEKAIPFVPENQWHFKDISFVGQPATTLKPKIRGGEPERRKKRSERPPLSAAFFC